MRANREVIVYSKLEEESESYQHLHLLFNKEILKEKEGI